MSSSKVECHYRCAVLAGREGGLGLRLCFFFLCLLVFYKLVHCSTMQSWQALSLSLNVLWLSKKVVKDVLSL